MNEREYVKLNTSIQTGSNARNLLTDEEGNLEATIELRLPANIFDSNEGTRHMNSVDMQTSKMRLSMENTPIIQLPIDEEETRNNLVVSKCELDVYPFSMLEGGTWKPDTLADSALPYYKDHKVTIQAWLYNNVGTDIESYTIYWQYTGVANTETALPKNSIFYPAIVASGLLNSTNHLMKLVVPSNHEKIKVQDGACYLKNISSVMQMLQDGIENAMTYASVSDNVQAILHLVNTTDAGIDSLQPPPNKNVEIDLGARGKYYLWKTTTNLEKSTYASHLQSAIKPTVRISDQAITISYDSAAFNNIIPLLWNPAYVNTFTHPEQMSFDELRKDALCQPPAKRVYQYGVTTSDDPASYNFNISTIPNCGVINLIANRATVDTFSFLPWIKINTSDITTTYNKVRTTETWREGQDTVRYNKYTFTPVGQAADIILSKFQGYTVEDILREDDPPENPAQGVYVALWYKEINGEKVNYEFWTRSRSMLSVYQRITEPYVVNFPAQVLSTEETATQQIDEYTRVVPVTTPQSEIDTISQEQVTFNEYSGEQQGTPICELSFEVNGEQKWIPLLVHEQDETYWVAGSVVGRMEVIGVEPTYITHVTKPAGVFTTLWYKLYPVQNDANCLYATSSYVSCTYEYKDVYSHNTAVVRNNVLIATETGVNSDMLPNLDVGEDNEFYILDGTGGSVTVGSPTPTQVIVPDSLQSTVTEATTYQAQQFNSSIQWRCQSIFDNGIPTNDYFYIRQITLREAPSEEPPEGEYVPAVFWEYDISYDGTVDMNDYTNSQNHKISICWARKTGDGSSSGTTFAIDNIGVITSVRRSPTSFNERHDPPVETTPPEPTTSSYTVGYKINIGEETIDFPWVTAETSASVTREEDVENARYYYIYRTTNTSTDTDYSTSMAAAYFNLPDEKWSQSTQTKFLPWVPRPVSAHLSAPFQSYYGVSDEVVHVVRVWQLKAFSETQSTHAYHQYYTSIIATVTSTEKQVKARTIRTVSVSDPEYTTVGNVQLSFAWDNLPTVVLSPIASIVLTLDGMQVTQEIQPVNISQLQGSSLTSTIPVIENFYSLAQTLRDLHDELVVAKESFDDTATYTIDAESGRQRTLKFSAKYITKDGRLHQIYIPPNGVFSLQLTFGLSFYST